MHQSRRYKLVTRQCQKILSTVPEEVVERVLPMLEYTNLRALVNHPVQTLPIDTSLVDLIKKYKTEVQQCQDAIYTLPYSDQEKVLNSLIKVGS